MAAASAFPSDVLDLFDAEEEVRVETVRRDGSPRSTIIWIVVEAGVAYIRSVRGPEGRWYQEIVRTPNAAIEVAGRHIPIRAEPATDAASVTACNRALARKYAGDPSTPAMLVEDALPTTLRVVPG